MKATEQEKQWMKQYQLANKEKIAERKRRKYLENRERLLQKQSDYRANNPDKVKQQQHEWYVANKEYCMKVNASRRRRIRQSTPPWQDYEELEAIYQECQRITRETGIQHNVDHIIPLKHELVSGLTVPWNLQIITAKDNISKSNKFRPIMVDDEVQGG